MALSAIALTVIILVLVILCLTFGPSWSMAFLILFGVIGHAVHEEKQEEQIPPDTSAPASAPAPSTPALEHVVNIPPNASAQGIDVRPEASVLSMDTRVDAPNPVADPPALSVADDPASAADVAPNPAVNAPADIPDLSADALAPPVDASALAPVVDVAGKKRGKPESSGFKFDVYLSFRGTDVHRKFLDHLCLALGHAGISAFTDDGKYRVRGEMLPELKEVINRSRISIVIISRDYAVSRWCLMQLVQMWERRESKGHTIIPIFYDVSPSDVRHLARDIGQASRLHKKRADSETIKNWMEVLGYIAALPRFSGKLYEGFEGQLAEEVVLRVARILRDDGLAVTDKLVGIDLHVQEMMRKLGVAHTEGRETEVHGEDVRVIGICGESGVRKTTLAKVIYNEVHTLFEACSFLEGISAKGVRVSQQLLIADLLNQEPAPLESVDEGIKKIEHLFRNKKVLIVLDDVDEDEQIKALVGKPTWFGSGSRIIVTMNNKKVLSAFDVGAYDRGTVEEYEIEPMSDDHALRLFHYHAFQGNAPEEVSENDSLSKDIVKAIGGVPKDIVHYASNLGRNMGIDSWRGTLELLQERGRTGGLPKSVVQEDRSLEIPLKTSERIITEDMD